MKRVVKQPLSPPEETDLRSITRRSDICRTIVTIIDAENETRHVWMIFGSAEILTMPHRKYHVLGARMTEGAADADHDSAWAMKLPLIGLQLDTTPVRYHATRFVAWVDPGGEEDFHVPRPGYNPMRHPEAYTCTDCDGPDHIIVPDDLYVPPLDAELFRMVTGRQIEISIGPVYEDP